MTPANQSERRDALTRLAERVEATEGPDRELDFAIAAIIGIIPEGYQRAQSHGRVLNYYWHSTDSHAPHIIGEKFTASLDAAMTLVPAHSLWGAGSDIDGPYARVVPPIGNGWVGSSEQRGYAATPALALTAAALRALAAKEA